MGPAHVILSFDKPQLTVTCLNSLIPLAQARSEKIILVHNGSSAKTLNQLQNTFSDQIEHLVLPNNLGFSGGANWGLKKAFESYPWVFFHTNDTTTEQLPIELPSRPGLFAPLILKRKSNAIDSIGGYIDLGTFKPNHFRDLEVSTSVFKQPSVSRMQAPYVPGTAFLMDVTTYELSQGFDESYHTYWEDIDLSYRLLHSAPNRLGLIPSWTLRHAIGKTCHKKPYYTQQLFPQNRNKFRAKFNL